jgi:hypothetical protein
VAHDSVLEAEMSDRSLRLFKRNPLGHANRQSFSPLSASCAIK